MANVKAIVQLGRDFEFVSRPCWVGWVGWRCAAKPSRSELLHGLWGRSVASIQLEFIQSPLGAHMRLAGPCWAGLGWDYWDQNG